MDELIEDMRQKGLITFIAKGKAWTVFNLLHIFANTIPYEVDTDSLVRN